jgi:DNA-directed RNA polymerase subunit N (RpoN/RPB10)
MKMQIKCISCGREINLDHEVFENYAGPIKCFCCSAMMEVKTAQGALCSLLLARPKEKQPPRKRSQQKA